MKATINYNHIAPAAEDIENIMADVERHYLSNIAEARKAVEEPIHYKTFFLRRPKVITHLSFDDYWAEHWDDKRFRTHCTGDERIHKAITTEHGHYWIDDDGFNNGGICVRFGNLDSLCHSLYWANVHRRKMAHQFNEAINVKAVSVTLTDKDLSDCNYYRRMLLNAQS